MRCATIQQAARSCQCIAGDQWQLCDAESTEDLLLCGQRCGMPTVNVGEMVGGPDGASLRCYGCIVSLELLLHNISQIS